MGLARVTALLQIFYKCMISYDKLVGVMMVDLSADFDLVDHPLLLEKLRVFGLREKMF